MACIPTINLPDDDSRAKVPSIRIDDGEPTSPTTVRKQTATSLTTVKITPENHLSTSGPGQRPRRRSVIEIENTTVTESFALVPKPLSEVGGGLLVPPASRRRRISVVQWRDINESLFNKDVRFDDDSAAGDQQNDFFKDVNRIRCIEDTFWPGKRKLMPRYEAMEKLDEIAINGPPIPQTDVKALVNELTKNTDGEIESFRVIFRWIAHNISYDTNYLETGERAEQSAGEVLRTGKAICGGFSELLCNMCSIVGINCETVSGASKAIGFYPGSTSYLKEGGKHAWNRVSIGGQWYLCDAAWAAGVSSRGQDGKYTFERRWGEGYFIANPEQFAATHFQVAPDAPNNVELDRWSNNVQVGRAAFLYDLKCLSHDTGIIHTKDNTVLIGIQSEYPLDTFCCLTEGDHMGAEIPQHVVTWWEGNVLKCNVQLPRAGRYVFTAFGTLPDDEQTPSDSSISSKVSVFYGTRLMTFTIHAEGAHEDKVPLPVTGPDSWGVDPSCIRQGFVPISHKSPFVKAHDGNACISFKQGVNPIPLIFNFSHFDTPEENLENNVYIETVGERIVCHISCPRPGKYSFVLKTRLFDDIYHRAAAYLITSSRDFKGGGDSSITFPKGPSGVWGPNDAFYEMGMTVRGPDSSTIISKDGDCYFAIRCHKSRDLEMKLTLKGAGSESELRSGHASMQSAKGKSTSTTTISLRLSEAGLYHLKLFARVDSGADMTYVGSWLVVCETPSYKSLFPKRSVNCGPTEEFNNHGLEIDQEALVETSTGECEVQVTLTQEVFLTFSLKLGDSETDIHQGQTFGELVKRDGKTVAVFKFRLQDTGLFAFRLFVKKTQKQDKATYVGMWLIDCHEASKEESYPPRSGLWGPNHVFHNAGMSVVDRETSHIRLANGDGQLCIRHSTQRSARKMSFRIDKNGTKHDATRIVSAETRWSSNGSTDILTVLQFRIDQPGMYALLIFDGSRQSNAFAGHWLLECQEPTQGSLFPEHSGLWGPSEHFVKKGMAAEDLDGTSIRSESGECRLVISSASEFKAHFHLYEDVKSNRLPKDHVGVEYTNNGRFMALCTVKLPHPGLFGLQFYAADKGVKTLSNCGQWMLVWDKT